MEEFDKELAQYGILAKYAQKLIEKERVCVFGNAEIETIDIKILQEKGIKCLDIKSKKIKNIIFVKDISLDMFFSGVTFTNEIKTDSKFTGELDFSGCTFKEEVNFQQANFKNFLCVHTTFEKQVSFLSAVFGNEKIISFSDVKFLNSANFTNAIFNSDMDFYKVFFQKRLSFSRAKFNCNKAKFNIECKDEARFIGVAGKNITIIESNFENNLTLGVTFDLLNIIDSEILKDLTLNNSIGNNIGIINSTIEKNTDLSFLLTKNIFLDGSTFKGEIKLSINGFLDMQNINFKNITFGKLYIPKEIFEKSVNFERCVFLQDINFKDYTFNEITFNTCIFKGNAYFNNSNFTKNVDFHESEFKKTACFYGVRFDKTPNFSQAIFKENLNVVNTNLNFTFGNLQERIKQEYKDFNETNEKKSLDKFANDFRDSFRTFKNALIKDNNLLDASNFHKYELYCKELELENKKVTTFKDIVDRYQLFFYRKLCDHHTNLLLNAKWLLYIVALYVLLLGKMIWVYPVLIIIFLASIYLCKIKNIWLNLSSVTVLMAIIYCPKMIFGFTNLFTSNLNYWQNLITTVYVVVIGLVLFSLQKTARKNSIVPS
ncbi:pentapeptide repeat-containing protein [Campylobacter coli]